MYLLEPVKKAPKETVQAAVYTPRTEADPTPSADTAVINQPESKVSEASVCLSGWTIYQYASPNLYHILSSVKDLNTCNVTMLESINYTSCDGNVWV